MNLNVGSLMLSASRFKVWTIYPSTSRNHSFDFLSNAFKTIGGVPEEILINNSSTMMDQARAEGSEGKFNNKFKQLAGDFGFKIVSCIRARPNTKAKVENPMRIIDEIMNYNGIVDNLDELPDGEVERLRKILQQI
ncbi:DDE-type integrase/transposase/recombinase [Clostridium botulinum]|nr:DDE-type integrase/transposase/recombinase [Clostridium botulinum]